MAVASGRRLTKTIEWAAFIYCRASAVNKGKPTTTPKATIASGHQSCLAGFFLKQKIRIKPKTPAMTALAAVRKPGSKPVTATRVAGNEPAKLQPQ